MKRTEFCIACIASTVPEKVKLYYNIDSFYALQRKIVNLLNAVTYLQTFGLKR